MPPKKDVTTHLPLTLIGLIQAVFYAGIWLWNDYVASYLTLVFPAMILVILLIAVVADLIEPSGISWKYYGLMMMSILIPVVIGVIFFLLFGREIAWMKPM